MEKVNLLVAIPAFNEADIIVDTIEGLSKIEEIDRIVVIDDGSIDNTSELVTTTGVDLIRFDKNRGKGAALKEVFESYDFEYICLLDADLGKTSHLASKLIEPVLDGSYDFSIAEFPRLKKSGVKSGLGLVKGLAMKGIKYYTGVEMYNSLSGQRVYRRQVIESISYMPNNYGIEVAMTAKALKEGYSYINVGINMSHRYSNKSLKGYIHRAKQFWQILKTFIAMKFKRW